MAQNVPAEDANGYKVVRVQVVLAAPLFANPNPAPIVAFGTVALDVAVLTDGRQRKLLIHFASLVSSNSGNNEEEEVGLLQGKNSHDGFSLTVELVGNNSVGGLSTTPVAFSTMVGVALLAGMIFAKVNVVSLF